MQQMHRITLAKGLLTVEGGVSMSGVSLEMIVSLRELLATTSELLRVLEGSEAIKDPEIECVYHRAQILLKYLRESKKTITKEITDEQTKPPAS